MPSVDLVLFNATVVTMNADYDVFEPGALAIRGNQIEAVGPESEILQEYQAGEILDCRGRAVIPGLINSHTHAPMTLMRGLADDLRLDVWLMGYMMPVEREFVSPDFCRLGTFLACAEMIRGGVTCFADMYYFEEHVARATAEAGMRAVAAQSVLKFPTPDAGSYEDSLVEARAFIERWKSHPLIVPSVAIHAPYTSTPEIVKACRQLAVEMDVPLQIHIAETAFEVEESRRLYGMPEVPWLEQYGLFDARVICAHCVHIDEGEIRSLYAHRAGVAHNPTSNLKLASGLAPVVKMLDQGLNVGIGTDGPASNNDLDMFEEMRLAAFLAKGISNDPTALPAKQAFDMATRMGARALHIGELTGSLEPGKRADLAIVNLASSHTQPKFQRDPNAVYSQLVYATKSTDVTDVIVDGRWLMRERKLLGLDEAELTTAAQDYAQRIDGFLVQREQSVLSKLVAIGGLEQEESFEVQIKARVDNPEEIIRSINGPGFSIVRKSHYREFDTYFLFSDPEQGRVRYREDEFINDKDQVFNVRYRLTLTGPKKEQRFEPSVLLSRSRFIAPAPHSLRFYREYFRPAAERTIEKDRLRWLVKFRSVEFFVNLDRLLQPGQDTYYLEVKSRTWSKRDAEEKARLIGEVLPLLGVKPNAALEEEYVDLVASM